MRKNNKPVHSEILPQDKYFSKNFKFGLSEGTAFCKELFRHSIYTVNSI